MFRLTAFSFSVPVPGGRATPLVGVRKGFALLPVAGSLTHSVTTSSAVTSSNSVSATSMSSSSTSATLSSTVST